MYFNNLTDEELLLKLYNELKAEGAVNPAKVIEKFLEDGRISSLFDFEKAPTIEFEEYSKIKSEVLQRSRINLAQAFKQITFSE